MLLTAAFPLAAGLVAEELELAGAEVDPPTTVVAAVLVAPIVDLSSAVLVLAYAEVVGATRVVFDAAVASALELAELEIVADTSLILDVMFADDVMAVTVDADALEQEIEVTFTDEVPLTDEETEDEVALAVEETEDEEEVEPPVMWNG